jgi:hypothetical protein
MLKGTYARDFQSLFLKFILHLSVTINTKRRTANIFENVLKIRPDIQSFRSLAVFTESAKLG